MHKEDKFCTLMSRDILSSSPYLVPGLEFASPSGSPLSSRRRLCYRTPITVLNSKLAMASPPEEVSKPKTVSRSSPAPSQWEPPVTCVQCGGELKDPHLLACLHCVCRECLPKAVREDGRLKCPAPNCGDCSTTWRQPDVVDLPRCEKRARECVPVQCATVGRYVEGRKIVRKVAGEERIACGHPQCNAPGGEANVFCSTCGFFYCNTCEISHKWMESVTGKHDVKSVEAIRSGSEECDAAHLCKAVPLHCPRHKGEMFKYHCEVCDLLMCQACTVSKDSPHCPAYLSAEVPLPPQHQHAMELAQKVTACDKEQCRVARETAERWGTEVERKREEALRDTRQSFQAYRAMLDRREEQLCDKIRSVSETRKGNVADTIHLHRHKEDTLSNKQAMLSFLSTEGSPHEVISYRRVVDAGQPHRRSGAVMSRVMKFLPKHEAALQAAIEGFACVEVGACPANSTLEPAPDKVHWCSVNDPIVFTLTTADGEKTPCSVGGESVQAFLRPRPPIPGPSIKAAVNDEENGQYKVTFDLTYTGECELSVLVNGVHIRGSPFVVELHSVTDVRLLTRDVKTLCACRGTLQFSQQPGSLGGVAVAHNGCIFVSDYSHHKIHVFDAARKYVKCFGQQGAGNGQLRSPMSVAISAEGLLYVANNNGVDVMTTDGAFVRRIGCRAFATPWDVTVYNGEVYVADTGNNRVLVFSEDGQFVRTIGSQGSGPGQFSGPTGVAVLPDGELYVSDQLNGRVQVLTLQGVYIREFGKGQLNRQLQLQLSNDKHVLVADHDNHRVAIFDQDGTLVSSFPCAKKPVGLAVDVRGDLLVACWSSLCVQVY